MKRSFPVRSLLIVAVVLSPCVSVFAQQPSARERELEDLVRQLSAKVEELESRLNRLEEASPDRDTETRVEALEQTVQQIKEERPPAADSEEWTQIRLVFMASASSVRKPAFSASLGFRSKRCAMPAKL